MFSGATLTFQHRWATAAPIGTPAADDPAAVRAYDARDHALVEVGPDVLSANADLAVKVDWEGEVLDSWSWRSDRRLVEALGFRRVPAFRPDLDYRDPRTLQGGFDARVFAVDGEQRARKFRISFDERAARASR